MPVYLDMPPSLRYNLDRMNMSEPHRWRGYLKDRKSDQFLLLLTGILTVTTDLTIAIGVGVALGLAIRLHRRNIPVSSYEPPQR
jgi:Sulfate permease and related transporters (MFS superfamily)